MRRTAAVVGSIAIHVVVGVAMCSVEREPDVVTPAGPSIELVEVTIAAPAQSPVVSDHAGGGSPAAPTASTPVAHTRAAPRATSSPRVAGAPPRSFTSSSEAVSDGDREGGEGGGRGGGHGTGIGLGDGVGIDRPELPPAPPPPPPAEVIAPTSKARPARLIYPSRNREVADGELFIARVMVDPEGYVVGARIVRGFGGHADAQASSLIWRFRYAPALDEAGRPIRSTIDQRFLVGP
ncbi:MAG: tonB [Deltaproteobacteria bacterium]|nr:tonB [Deltaproteobacteria bacterium]